MKQIMMIKCDSCGKLQNDMRAMRTCGYCEHEGCIDCVKHRVLKKGLINTWLHTENTFNYGDSCWNAFEKGCIERGVDSFY